jgi:hypothetical protein
MKADARGVLSQDVFTRARDGQCANQFTAMQVDTLPQTGFRCPLCGEPLNPNATECTKCDWVRLRQLEDVRPSRNPRDIAAAVLSVVPGAGHYFKGYPVTAAVILLLGVPVVLLMAFTFTMFFGWLLVPVYWGVVAADAYLRKDFGPIPAPPRHD